MVVASGKENAYPNRLATRVNPATTAVLQLAAGNALAVNLHDEYAEKDLECRTVGDPLKCTWMPGKGVKLDAPEMRTAKRTGVVTSRSIREKRRWRFFRRKPWQGWYFIGNTSIG